MIYPDKQSIKSVKRPLGEGGLFTGYMGRESLHGEGEADSLVVSFSGTEDGVRKIGMVGRVGKRLHLYSHSVVVLIGLAVARGGRAFEPVAGVYLHSGLCGAYCEHTTGFLVLKHSGIVDEPGFLPAVERPA